MTKAAAETPRASARPVLLLLAEATCKKARNWSKSPLQEATNTPTPPGAGFQPNFCACFERLWFWAPTELPPRQDLAHWGENSALHLPVLWLGSLARETHESFLMPPLTFPASGLKHQSLSGCPPGWDSLSPHPLLGEAPVAAPLCALLPRHRLCENLWKRDKITAGRNHRRALVGKDIILRRQRAWPPAGRARRSAARRDDGR